MSVPLYRRLPGKRRTLIGGAALYLGQDHLLQVRSHRVSEEYQRFYFKDVQSITLRRTAPFHYVWAILIFLVAAAIARFTGNAVYVLGIVAAGATFLWLRGPSCEARLQTAVTSDRLRSLHRLKTAQRVVPMLREQIESVQGRVVSVPEEYASDVAPSVTPPVLTAVSSQALIPRRHDHLLCFAFLALECVLFGIWLAWPTRLLEQTVAIGILIEFLILVTVLVRQNQQRIPKPLRMVTYFAMGRWLIVQLSSISIMYKVVLVDRVRTNLNPLTLERGPLTYIAFLSLLLTALGGLWFSLQRESADE